ncbi:transposase [Belliella filtrata]|uniref:transposase n=1 Tax=Belliella filtrata TaxID=2923435 RepID=UPI00293E917F|nr:transposase [Belliella filtrata]
MLITKQNREELHQYITGIAQNRKQKILSIFAMPDHTQVLVELSQLSFPAWIVRKLSYSIEIEHLRIP